jgi:protein-disulfide isomerase
LPGHAKALGLDQAQFGACLDGGKYAAQVTRNLEAGQRLGVKGTPSFFVGSYDPVTSTVSVSTQLNGAQPFSAFKTVLDGLLGPGR